MLALRCSSAATSLSAVSRAEPMSRTDVMPPSGTCCLDSWMVLPPCVGLVSLRRSTVGDATPFAGLASGTLTSSYTSGAMSLYVLKSHSRVPIASSASPANAEGVATTFSVAGDASEASPIASAVRRGMDASSAASRDARTRVTVARR